MCFHQIVAGTHLQVVHSLALLDPVCMMTCSPHLLRNFIYTSPRLNWQAPTLHDVMDAARYVCSRDLMVAAAFCRRSASSPALRGRSQQALVGACSCECPHIRGWSGSCNVAIACRRMLPDCEVWGLRDTAATCLALITHHFDAALGTPVADASSV